MERVEQDMKIVKFNDKISEILIVDFSLRSSLQFRNKKTRKLEKSKLVSKPVSRINQEHNHKQYVQLHIKYTSVRVEVGLEGRVGLTHKELTKYFKYTHFNLFTRLLVIK